MSKPFPRLALIAFCAILLISCAIPAFSDVPATSLPVLSETPNAPVPAVTITNTPIVTPQPQATATEAPTATPQPTLTATPFIPFSVAVLVDNANMRKNPGTLFPVWLMLNKGDPFQVLGQTQDGEWYFGKTTGNIRGWMFNKIIEDNPNLRFAPVFQPENVFAIQGYLDDSQGNPISGVQFAIEQGNQRNDALTDAQGKFIAYMPASISGQWTVTYTAVACTSNLMDSACNYLPGKSGRPDPDQITITIPNVEVLKFTWR